jgi:L-ascorbate metabolism protein UlaG (beta-lactamase superfamily)
MKITWFGQSAFRIEHDNAVVMVDPFLSGVPWWKGGWEIAAKGVTHVLVTHGHNDHLGDAVAILKGTGAMGVANAEISDFLIGQGVPEKQVNSGNHGGTVDCGPFTTTFVNAIHSSSWTKSDGSTVYLGNPNGLVLHFPDGKSVYHMGDTDIFSDMALIGELHAPKVGLVPIGDRYTMGGAVAALACRRFFKFEAVIPCHYGSFPILEQTPDKFIEGMQGSGTKVVTPKIGEAVTI